MQHHHLSVVHKFGGTSLASSEHFRAIPQLISEQPAAIVVSATAGTTNILQQLLHLAQSHVDFIDSIKQLYQRHDDLIADLFSNQQVAKALSEQIEQDCHAIEQLLNTACLLQSYDDYIRDKVLGYGESWSAAILSAYLAQTYPAIVLDATKVLITDHKHNQQYIDWQASAELLQQYLRNRDYQYLVITGFVARNRQGQAITLGRNGSDYSAAIFARLLAVEKLVLWTDVDGVYSADPRKVRSAFVLDELSYEEALELAYFGATVIHPQTIFPAIAKNIPIYIKNSQAPRANGTLICQQKQANQFSVQGLSCIDDIALLTIEGSGMTGVSGIAARTFQCLHYQDISVILISQASSEHSICLAVKGGFSQQAQQALTEAFEFELNQQLIKRISVDNDCAILAAVGDGMVGSKGVAGRLCATLAKANVNIHAIAQGSSERNISVVVAQQDANRALRAVHAGFYLSRETLSIGLIGPGQVGSTLLQQIANAFERLQAKQHVNLLVRGVMNSKKMLLSHQQIDFANWQSQLQASQQACDVTRFVDHLLDDDMPHAVVIDCTANQVVADYYHYFIERGVHIVTPNKRANSGDFAYYQQLQALATEKKRAYLYETTVCAGLPVIKTLQDIIATGDTVLHIEGVVSGTLSYIFGRLASGEKFSEIVGDAKQQGYTEPDPRDDLSGMDVARKFVCLAREMGFSSHLQDLQLSNLVPEHLRQLSVDEFMQRLPECDQYIDEQLAPIFAKQQKPCYLGEINKQGVIAITIKGVSDDHPLSHLQGTDNMIIFTTERYHQQPLVIQGPGAGMAVTAAGVFADLLRLVSKLD